MIIDCISDLHGHYPKLEGGDLLIVAGDLTADDSRQGYEQFFDWLNSQDYKKIIFISGNHDNQAMSQFDWGRDHIEYLCDSGTEFEGLKIFGSPWTKTFEGMNPNCKAFTYDTEEELAEKWALIPDDIDILVTHSPGYAVLDTVDPIDSCCNFHAGSKTLALEHKNRLRVKLHVFGHIHESYGLERLSRIKDDSDLILVNASHVNEHYEPVNNPIRIEL